MSYKIVITGANRGLGLEMAKQLVEAGHRVFALNRGDSPEVQALAAAHASTLSILKVDTTDEDQIAAAAAQIKKAVGSIDILINNAAIHLEGHRPALEDTDFQAIAKTFEINSIGPLKVAKHLVPLLLAGGKKTLANISSEAGSIGDCWRDSEFGYTMSKAALNMETKILQNRLKKDGVKVLAIHPGWVRTEMGGPQATLSPEESATGVLAQILKTWPLDGPIYIDYQGKTMNW